MKRKDFLKIIGFGGLGLFLPRIKKQPDSNAKLIDPCHYYDAEYTYDSSLKKHILTKVTFVKGFNKLPESKRRIIRAAISQTLEPGRQYYPEVVRS